jgi:hypothetical protein
MRRLASVVALAASLAAAGWPEAAIAQAPETGRTLYLMTLLRAAPGRLAELIVEARAHAAGALVLRHSQGDHWDVMVLRPVASYAAHFAGTAAVAGPYSANLIAWQEDEFVRGPGLDAVAGFMTAGLYHVEMFDAAAGRLAELTKEREMENAYLSAVGRPRTLIFVRELGAAWDVFTIGAYRDWRHYAERDLIAPDKALAAARAAGFESDAAVGPYMRSLILTHHDTLATPVR